MRQQARNSCPELLIFFLLASHGLLLHVYCIVTMTTTTANCLSHFSLELLLHSSNSLTVPRMEMELGMHVCNILSMTTTTTNSPRHFLKITSSLLKLARMEGKLGAHVYYIVFTTTKITNSFRHFSFLTPQTC